MTANFSKLDKFEGVDFRRWQKKMHFLLTTLKVVYVLSTPIPDYKNVEFAKALLDALEAKYMAEDASSKKFLEELSLVQLGSHLRIEESLRAQENDKPKGKDVVGSSSVNMVEDRRATKTNDRKGKGRFMITNMMVPTSSQN
ncbi:UNVERIFIED_CONTAM: hypothetical protein Slati_3511700 [Sesamum latifolium]|uniref:Zinc finger, CCHC-type n=1 Tax=Sesamum latifolium TaxID=2727402 RepID=A0AAW2UJ38_9LAMI